MKSTALQFPIEIDVSSKMTSGDREKKIIEKYYRKEEVTKKKKKICAGRKIKKPSARK